MASKPASLSGVAGVMTTGLYGRAAAGGGAPRGEFCAAAGSRPAISMAAMRRSLRMVSLPYAEI